MKLLRTTAVCALSATLLATIAANPLQAVLVELEPVADADIRAAFPQRSFDREVLVVGGNTLANAHNAYIRFELPNDFREATSASFSITRHIARPPNLVTQLWGLNDGVPGEADWMEGNYNNDDNNSPFLTWNNAPGKDTASPSGFIDSTALGTITTIGTNNGGAPGDSYSVSDQALVDFLNVDTDGFVTFMLSFASVTSNLPLTLAEAPMLGG